MGVYVNGKKKTADTTVEVTGTSQVAESNIHYISNNGGLVTITLPATATVGDIIKISGKGAGGWKLAQNASQVIYFITAASTIGTGGYIASTNQYDCITTKCITANTSWNVEEAIGNLNVV